MRTFWFSVSAALLVILAAGFSIAASAPAYRKPPCIVWIGVTGKSMLPKYPESHMVEMDIAFPFDELKVGDEVVFWNHTKTGGHTYLFHPIIAKRKDHFLTQGINKATNPRPDSSWLTRENYVGRATGKSAIIVMSPISE